MKATCPLYALLGLCLAACACAAEPDTKPSMKETLKTLLIEDAKNAAAQPAPAVKKSASAPLPAAPPKPDAKPAEQPAKLLPKVEVRGNRITELDVQLAKQNEEIAREKVNTKPTKLDETLNGPKISAALALFGGQSSEDRANVAKERVAMMEEERDIIEAIAQAKTKEEKAELEKLLREMKATRRELEKSLK